MKIKKLISALAASMIIIGISGASAQNLENPERTYTLPGFTVEGYSDPVLKAYNAPRVPESLIGSSIVMYYTIDTQGNVRGIRSSSPFFTYSDLDAIMSNALRNWKFEPATNSAGDAVAIKVAMPVEVVPQGSAASGYASINFAGVKLTVKTG